MKIQTLRERRAMTQAELAAQMGVLQSAVANWERELCLPRSRQLPMLARVLGCSIDDLFEPEEPGVAV